jgi:hypothetical protein
MEVLHIEKKGRMLSALDGFHIYRLTKQKLQINEASTDVRKPIYDILIKQPKRHKTQPILGTSTHPHITPPPLPTHLYPNHALPPFPPP